MGAVKNSLIQMQEEMMAKCEMPQSLFHKLSSQHESIILRGHYLPSMKDEYRKDKEWSQANETLKEAIQYREEIEERIRVEKAVARDIEND
ncbi:MAG: hypothetical protein AAF600_13060 [Bacteroidota bacterium]